MWLANEINVAEEHFASHTTKMVMAQLLPHATIQPSNGKTMLAAAVAGNQHDIGLQAVADFFEMDGWGVDVSVTGSQKGLMTPPGLGFVAAGKRAAAAHQTAGLRTRYWDWTQRNGDQHYQKYCGTPPEHMLFGLRKALDMLLEEGLENVFERHRLLAEGVRRAVGVWAEGGEMEFNILAPADRANSVTTILLREGLDPRLVVHVLPAAHEDEAGGEEHCRDRVPTSQLESPLQGRGLRGRPEFSPNRTRRRRS